MRWSDGISSTLREKLILDLKMRLCCHLLIIDTQVNALKMSTDLNRGIRDPGVFILKLHILSLAKYFNKILKIYFRLYFCLVCPFCCVLYFSEFYNFIQFFISSFSDFLL